MHEYDVECECAECVKATQERKVPKDPWVICPFTVDPKTEEFPMRKISDVVRFDQH